MRACSKCPRRRRHPLRPDRRNSHPRLQALRSQERLSDPLIARAYEPVLAAAVDGDWASADAAQVSVVRSHICQERHTIQCSVFAFQNPSLKKPVVVMPFAANGRTPRHKDGGAVQHTLPCFWWLDADRTSQTWPDQSDPGRLVASGPASTGAKLACELASSELTVRGFLPMLATEIASRRAQRPKAKAPTGNRAP